MPSCFPLQLVYGMIAVLCGTCSIFTAKIWHFVQKSALFLMKHSHPAGKSRSCA